MSNKFADARGGSRSSREPLSAARTPSLFQSRLLGSGSTMPSRTISELPFFTRHISGPGRCAVTTTVSMLFDQSGGSSARAPSAKTSSAAGSNRRITTSRDG